MKKVEDEVRNVYYLHRYYLIIFSMCKYKSILHLIELSCKIMQSVTKEMNLVIPVVAIVNCFKERETVSQWV